jgi:hypothetical protein
VWEERVWGGGYWVLGVGREGVGCRVWGGGREGIVRDLPPAQALLEHVLRCSSASLRAKPSRRRGRSQAGAWDREEEENGCF